MILKLKSILKFKLKKFFLKRRFNKISNDITDCIVFQLGYDQYKELCSEREQIEKELDKLDFRKNSNKFKYKKLKEKI